MKKLILIITLATTQLNAFPYLMPEDLGAKGSFLIDANDKVKTTADKERCVITYHNNIIISKYTCKKVNQIIDDSKANE